MEDRNRKISDLKNISAWFISVLFIISDINFETENKAFINRIIFVL